jgi:hypothetical protein
MPSYKWFAISFLFVCIAEAGEWDKHTVSLRASVGKIRAKESEIAQLIEVKKNVTDQQQMSEILVKITKEHKELVKFYDEFEKEKQHIRFEHPEEGAKLDRQYRSQKLKSVADFEFEGGIDGRLTELKEKVKKKYGEPANPHPVETPYVPMQKKKAEEAEREAKRIKLSK